MHISKLVIVCLLVGAPEMFAKQAHTVRINLNFDKLLVGTDKMIYIEPPYGTTWAIYQGGTFIERLTEGATVLAWIESRQAAPYRDPETGEMRGCQFCVTIQTEQPASARRWFPLIGQSMPIVISWPDRLIIAVTPVHGGLSVPLMTWTRFQISESIQ